MDNAENKYEKNENFNDIHKNYKFQKEPFNDDNHVNNAGNIGDQVKKWIDSHPIGTMCIISIGTTIIAYKLYQKLITDAVFKANKKTIKYMSYDPDIAF